MTSSDAIHRLLFEYCEYTDADDLDRRVALFEHASIHFPSGVVTGPKNIERAFELGALRDEQGTRRTSHVCTNIILDIDEDLGTATSRSRFTVFNASASGVLEVAVVGRYHDRFERHDGIWRFAERSYLVDFTAPQTPL